MSETWPKKIPTIRQNVMGKKYELGIYTNEIYDIRSKILYDDPCMDIRKIHFWMI